MLISTTRGFFRRLFTVDQTAKALREQATNRSFLNVATNVGSNQSESGRVAASQGIIESGETSKSVSVPSNLLVEGTDYKAILILESSLGAASEIWVNSGSRTSSAIEVEVDADPTQTVSFSLVFISGFQF